MRRQKIFKGLIDVVDIMGGDEFALLVISEPLLIKEINIIEQDLFKIYDKISPFVKKTIQKSISKNRNNSETDSNTNSETRLVGFRITKIKPIFQLPNSKT